MTKNEKMVLTEIKFDLCQFDEPHILPLTKSIQKRISFGFILNYSEYPLKTQIYYLPPKCSKYKLIETY